MLQPRRAENKQESDKQIRTGNGRLSSREDDQEIRHSKETLKAISTLAGENTINLALMTEYKQLKYRLEQVDQMRGTEKLGRIGRVNEMSD